MQYALNEAEQKEREYRIEGLKGPEQWEILVEGKSIGHKRIQRFHPAEVSKVRLIVSSSIGRPFIRSLEVYCVG